MGSCEYRNKLWGPKNGTEFLYQLIRKKMIFSSLLDKVIRLSQKTESFGSYCYMMYLVWFSV
jgi:hypothetical protein